MLDLSADRATFFGDFEESIVFRPANDGPPRTIEAVVHREQIDPPPGTPNPGRRPPTFQIEAANDPIYGITPREAGEKGAQIDVAWLVGETPRSRAIQRIVSQDAAHIRVEVNS